MDKEQLCKSLIKWLQTFNVDAAHGSVEELSDGVAMAQVLAQVAPEWFDSVWMIKIKHDTASNWRLKVSNLKKILKGILDYYTEILGQQIIDFRLPDVAAIGEQNNAAELGRLLQLILGCAVNCDHKQEYIQAIMGMEEAIQHVVMNAIQDLMTKETPPPIESFSEVSAQVRRLMDELQLVTAAKEQMAQTCHDLDQQVVGLQEERHNLMSENERLTERLAQAEGLDDLSSAAGRRNQALQNQVDHVQEELYRLESSRDEYRLKVDELEIEIRELQEKNDELQRMAEEARLLKDEVDVLRETSDKVAKYESVIESYKKKLDEMGDLRRQLKLMEEKNTGYVQKNMEFEEEIKRGTTVRSQLEMYKKNVQELRLKLSEETKKADKADFEKKKLQEKLSAVEREKESLMAERDTLRETNEELNLNQLLIAPFQPAQGSFLSTESTSSQEKGAHPSAVGEFEMIPPEIKEQLIRLQHENKMLRLNRQSSDEEQIQVLQTMLDDSKERQSELETENRLARQRILEVESQLEETQSNHSAATIQEGTELRQKVNSHVARIRELESELQVRNAKIEQRENLARENDEKVQQLQEVIARKDEEIRDMDRRYKKYLEKAKQVMNNLDPKHQPSAPDVTLLRNQLQEKDKCIETLERESKETKALREIDEKLIITAFHNLGVQLHRKAVEERIANTAQGQSFLARQRQATTRRTGVGLGQSDFFD